MGVFGRGIAFSVAGLLLLAGTSNQVRVKAETFSLLAGPHPHSLRLDSLRSLAAAAGADKIVIHVLNRIGFGPAPGDIARVREIGLDKYIEQQLHPERLADSAMGPRLSRFETLAKSSSELAVDYFGPARMERRRAQQQAPAAAEDMKAGGSGGQPDRREMRTPEQMEAMRAERQVFAELSQQKLLRAAYSERQLEEVLVDFWFNHFNVFANKGPTRVYLTEYERDAIRPRVLGTFRELLGATAESPAMLFYLDNWQSSAADGNASDAPAGGTARLDRMRRGGFGAARRMKQTPLSLPPPNQRPRGLNENYARELMELHTLGVDGGYTQKDVQEVARAFTGWTIAMPRQGGGFRYDSRMHDDGEKVVLGHRIKAGGGRKDAEQVLDILATHPSTATFISTKLARRFVADAPPASLVDRAAARFRATGGDLREVVRTIVTSPEFFAPSAYRAKVKTPFEFVVSAVRAAGADAANAMPLVQAMRELGMPPYQCQPPTGYADRADAWVNTGALLGRMNFALALASGRLPGIRTSGVAGDVDSVRKRIVGDVLAGDLADSTISTVARTTDVAQMVALLLGSPEFQKR